MNYIESKATLMIEVILANKGFVVGFFYCFVLFCFVFSVRLSWHNLRTWACG